MGRTDNETTKNVKIQGLILGSFLSSHILSLGREDVKKVS